MPLDQLELTDSLEKSRIRQFNGNYTVECLVTPDISLLHQFFSINLKVTAICQICRLFVIIIHLFICSTVICKDIFLGET